MQRLALPVAIALAISACNSGGGGGTQQEVPENQGMGGVGDGAPGGSQSPPDAASSPTTSVTGAGATTPATTPS